MRRKLIYIIPVVLASIMFQVNTAYGFIDPSLVGWWKFDETSGTTAADSSGSGNDGTLQGDPQWLSGKMDGALSFDGDGDYVNCGNGPTLTIQDEITMAFWIKVDEFTNNYATVIAKGDSQTGTGSYRMSRGESSYAMHMGIEGTTSTPDPWFDGNKTVSDNQWHHIAGVYDGAEARIYVDGVLDASQEATGQINTSTANLYIGENAGATGRYWNGLIDDVRLYNRALTLEELELVIQGIPPTIAALPNPEDMAEDVIREVVLSWASGEFAAKHDVYFGTNFDDVNTATATNHPNVQVSLNQDDNTYDPNGLLTLGQTYYWRIDEVNDAHPERLWKGAVWSFTIELLVYPIEDITANASSSQSADMEPEKTIDGSGLNDNDQHSTEVTDMWLSSSTGQQPTWIKYDFGKIYKLNEMLVWNYNSAAELLVGFGLKNVTIQYSTDDINWPQLSDVPDFNQATGLSDYTYNTTVNFGDVEVKYVIITANSNWSGGLIQQYGLSEVRFLCIPVHAREPSPRDGETDVGLDVVLSWRAGREAATHKLYVSSNEQEVIEGSIAPISSIPVSGSYASYGPLSLELDTTYYWKVDEVNEDATPSTWQGDIWSFTTSNYVVVDDMESYGDANTSGPPPPPGSRIWYTWRDGYGWKKPEPSSYGNGTGSIVDVNSIISYGRQSLRFDYDNDGLFFNSFNHVSNPYYSELERTFESPQDWTQVGIKALTLSFYGTPDNNTNEPIWVKLTDQSDHSEKVIYGMYADEDVNNLAYPSWYEWNIDLADFGVDLTKITKLAIGIGDEAGTTSAGSGIVYFDDIRLYAARCMVSRLKAAEDLNNDCVVDYLDFDVLANDWLMKDQTIATTAASSTDLVAHWKLDDGSGMIAVDSSGNNHHGMIWGTPKWVSGQIGGALEFNGNDDFVEVSDLNLSTGTITITAWIKRKGDQIPWTGIIFHRSGNIACGIGFSGLADATNQLQYHWNRNSPSTYNFLSELTVPDREWAFVALVIERTKATLYLNGLSKTNQIGHASQMMTDINLGRDTDDRHFRGLIDDARIYSRALSEAEIAYLADASPGDGQLYIPVQSPAELYSAEPQGSQKIDLKDLKKLVQGWLEQLLWP